MEDIEELRSNIDVMSRRTEELMSSPIKIRGQVVNPQNINENIL